MVALVAGRLDAVNPKVLDPATRRVQHVATFRAGEAPADQIICAQSIETQATNEVAFLHNRRSAARVPTSPATEFPPGEHPVLAPRPRVTRLVPNYPIVAEEKSEQGAGPGQGVASAAGNLSLNEAAAGVVTRMDEMESTSRQKKTGQGRSGYIKNFSVIAAGPTVNAAQREEARKIHSEFQASFHRARDLAQSIADGKGSGTDQQKAAALAKALTETQDKIRALDDKLHPRKRPGVIFDRAAQDLIQWLGEEKEKVQGARPGVSQRIDAVRR